MLTETKLAKIIRRYDQPTCKLSTAYGDGGIDPLWSRFERAAGDQLEKQDATLARYAIWANTVRDNIIEAKRMMDADNTDEAQRLMIRAANSLSAFADVQAYFDPLGMGKCS